MKYRNIKTNGFVETNGVICGDLWELVEEPKKEEPTEEAGSAEPAKPKRKTRAKAK